MRRAIYIAIGCVLAALWVVGLLRGGGAVWIVAWFDVLGALWAFALALGITAEGASPRMRGRGASFALGVGLFAVWGMGLAAELPAWLLGGNALCGFAFLALAILPERRHDRLSADSSAWRRTA